MDENTSPPTPNPADLSEKQQLSVHIERCLALLADAKNALEHENVFLTQKILREMQNIRISFPLREARVSWLD